MKKTNTHNNEEKHTCCICGKKFTGYGNNPEPVKHEGLCCDDCSVAVIEERIREAIKNWQR